MQHKELWHRRVRASTSTALGGIVATLTAYADHLDCQVPSLAHWRIKRSDISGIVQFGRATTFRVSNAERLFVEPCGYSPFDHRGARELLYAIAEWWAAGDVLTLGQFRAHLWDLRGYRLVLLCQRGLRIVNLRKGEARDSALEETQIQSVVHVRRIIGNNEVELVLQFGSESQLLYLNENDAGALLGALRATGAASQQAGNHVVKSNRVTSAPYRVAAHAPRVVTQTSQRWEEASPVAAGDIAAMAVFVVGVGLELVFGPAILLIAAAVVAVALRRTVRAGRANRRHDP